MAKKAPKRNTLKLNLTGFNELITKLDKLDGDVKEAVTDALEQAGKKIGEDTKKAVQPQCLPAKGKYSKGNTEKSIIMDPKVHWSGSAAETGVGFDYDKPGAGGFLISGRAPGKNGTPRMAPDYELQKIYKKKAYMSNIQNGMQEVVQKEIKKKMEG